MAIKNKTNKQVRIESNAHSVLKVKAAELGLSMQDLISIALEVGSKEIISERIKLGMKKKMGSSNE